MMNTRDQFLIYFIKPIGRSGPVKIGVSGNPVKRMSECASWSPLQLELIATVPGTWEDERYLHNCLAAHHSHGEWFHASESVLSAIKMIVDANSVDPIRENLKPVACLNSLRNRATRARRRAA